MLENKREICQVVMVWTTVSDSETAKRLAGELVDSRLAACVQVDEPVTSHYRWKDVIEVETEVRLIAKTRGELAERVLEWLAQHHPYEEPELLVTPVIQCSEGYLRWVRENTLGSL